MSLRRDVPLTIMAVLLGLVAFGVAISKAFAGVGGVGKIGTLMSPNDGAPSGGSGPNPFGIVTEDGAQIITESDQPIITESAP